MILSIFVALSFGQAIYGHRHTALQIASKSGEIRREGRSRPIEYRVTYPVARGQFPLIVFSHGWRGSKDGYKPLAEHWAKHGYTVLQPTFTDSFSYLPRSEWRNAFNTRGGRAFANWDERVDDVRFLITNLEQLPEVKGRADLGKLGIGGHSFGSQTSILLGGGGPERYDQPGARALLLLSPQGKSALMTERSLASVSIPTLSVTGTNDTAITNTDPDDRKDPFKYSSPGDKYLLWIEGAHHNFGGISGAGRFPTSGPPNKDHVAYVQATTLAFWDAYLKSSAEAKRYLKSNEIGKQTKGKAILESK
jgi:predicted dienelactone hydrolase